MVPPVSHRVARVPRYSGLCYLNIILLVRDFHPLWSNFPVRFQFNYISNIAVLQPRRCRNNFGLGSSPFARHYLGNHYCFLFLRVLRCFSSPGLPPLVSGYPPRSGWVAPFGYLRIISYLHLPVAFRSLSRPSSPLGAKAFSIRSYLLFYLLVFCLYALDSFFVSLSTSKIVTERILYNFI